MGEDTKPAEERIISAKMDLADRYQDMLDSQLSAIENFDTKAWRIARLVGILLGVLFTGVSVFSAEEAVQLTVEYLPVIVPIGIGVSALVVSLIFSALCILSTTAGFGLTVELADALNEGEIDDKDYYGFVTKSYSKNIKNNIKVMQAKGRRLRYALSAMVVGILTLSTGGVLLFITLSYQIQIGLLIFLGILVGYILYYILAMRYSVLKNEEEDEITMEA